MLKDELKLELAVDQRQSSGRRLKMQAVRPAWRDYSGMIYTATLTNANLRLNETRVVADLLLREVSKDEWRQAIVEENVLQLNSPIYGIRFANYLRSRLEPLGEDLWLMVRDGDRDLATQAALAGAIKHSRLLGDFMDITVREQKALFAKELTFQHWTDFIEGCRGRDPEMLQWSDSTITKLRSVVFSILVEAGYLSDSRQRLFQNVFIAGQLADYLRDKSERYVLRCLEVAE